MKKYLKKQRLLFCLCITFFLPYIPLAQKVDSDTLYLGLPFKFYTFYLQHNCTSLFIIPAFLADVLIIYLIYTVILVIADKVKMAMKRRPHDENVKEQ